VILILILCLLVELSTLHGIAQLRKPGVVIACMS